ncbi:MAG: response regulator [Spirochaetaceae bacterium]|jgi:putative two-component system response regulator|nr:response regulator [Spirochaetaceae bacterium]
MGTEARKKIMLVDDNITNLVVGKNALSNQYDVFTLPSGEKLFKLLEKVIPDMILLDVEMPDMNGYEVIQILKKQEHLAHIPVIFLTAKSDDGSELQGLSLGAIDYIIKPFSPALLGKRIEVHLLVESQRKELESYNTNLKQMVRDKTQEVVGLQNAILQTVAELVESRDAITGGHIERTRAYLKILIRAMKRYGVYQEAISSWDEEIFLQSSQLHDVGKIAIKDSILFKQGKLTDEEFEEMKKHTTFGVQVIEKIGESTSEKAFLEHAKIMAGTHHEKWNGSGYPKGLRGVDIPLQGRLMAIVDVYDALLSVRPYKKALTQAEAVAIIAKESNGHFDPAIAQVFLATVQDFTPPPVVES